MKPPLMVVDLKARFVQACRLSPCPCLVWRVIPQPEISPARPTGSRERTSNEVAATYATRLSEVYHEIRVCGGCASLGVKRHRKLPPLRHEELPP
ncbi:MAG: hypothetical protein ACOYJ6_19685, partial [Caulobacterales bacterium]